MFILKIKTNDLANLKLETWFLFRNDNSVHILNRSKPSLNFMVQISGTSSSSVAESCSGKLTTSSGSETSSPLPLVIAEERTRKSMF